MGRSSRESVLTSDGGAAVPFGDAKERVWRGEVRERREQLGEPRVELAGAH